MAWSPALGLLVGASIHFVDSSSGVAALLGALAVVVVASTASEKCYGSRSIRCTDQAGDGLAQRLAHHDALTGQPNRQAFLARLQDILASRRRRDRLMLDLVGFKRINATLGCGRPAVAPRERAFARGVARDRHARARGVAMSSPWFKAALSIRSALRAVRASPAVARRAFDLFGHLTTIGARIGVTVHAADGRDPDALLEHARLALLRAQADPKDGFRFHEEALETELHERKALERDLRLALARDQFEIHYQPQIDIASRRMVGVEALLRWNHPERGRIDPDQFIPLAEDSGLIVPIGAWILEQACAQAVRWHRAGATMLRVSVNMSPVQFRQPDLAGAIGEILGRTGLAAEHLELEITERILMQDSAANVETLRPIMGMGVRISIDDFRIGQSSLGYLRCFPFDEIKVDRSFVSALEHDPSAAAIVRATLSLGRSLGLVSVAQGVESASQLTSLREQGCCLAQGFYFSPPVHPREVDAMVQAAALQDHDVKDYEVVGSL